MQESTRAKAIDTQAYFASIGRGLKWYNYEDLKRIHELRLTTTAVGYLPARLARMFHELLAATLDMAVLPDVLGCWLLRRTVQGTPRNQHPAVTRLHTHLHVLAKAVHETSGLLKLMAEDAEELGLAA